MEHSRNYKKVWRWYNMNLWNEIRVRNAVHKGWITEIEYAEITGEDY